MNDNNPQPGQEPEVVVQAPQPMQMTYTQILHEAPGRLRKASQDAFDGRAQLERLRLELRLIEAGCMTEVAAEEVAPGKKRYSNAESREAAVRDYLSRDPGAQDLRRQIDDRLALNAKVEAYAAYWEAMQRNVRVLLLARSPFDAVMGVGDI